MRVNSIQSANFQARQRHINPVANDGIKQILSKMNGGSIVIDDNKSYLLKSLSDGENVLYDNRTSIHQPAQLALFDVGSSAQLVIDTNSGEIIDSKTTLFSTWSGILKQVTESVDKMLKNFDNESVVKRKYLTVSE